MSLPHCETLLLEPIEGVLRITLNRPQSRNAMSLAMVGELRAVLAAVRDDRSVRALVLRGAGGHFCAGGDIKDMAGARAAGAEAYRTLNRAFGSLLEEAQAAPQLLVALVEGAVLGGGFGLACVSDVAIAAADAQFGLPETSLGILPAQIAPFVVRRIGLTQARRLALTAARFDGREALRLGLVHFCEADADALEQRLEETLEQLRRCAERQRRHQGPAAGQRKRRTRRPAGRCGAPVRRSGGRRRRQRRHPGLRTETQAGLGPVSHDRETGQQPPGAERHAQLQQDPRRQPR